MVHEIAADDLCAIKHSADCFSSLCPRRIWAPANSDAGAGRDISSTAAAQYHLLGVATQKMIRRDQSFDLQGIPACHLRQYLTLG
ncbi:MAG: hypothetical protein U0694_00355 [Anaerolineae bacterium]